MIPDDGTGEELANCLYKVTYEKLERILFSFTICPVIIVSPLNLFTCLEGEICAELASVALHYTQRPIFAIFYNGLFPGPILYDVLSPSYLKIEKEIFSYLTSFCLRKDDHVDI